MNERHADVLVTTTEAVEGRGVIRYLGPVFAEHVRSSGLLRGLADDVRHALDDRAEEFDSELLDGRVTCVRELRRHAADLQAHAVVGVRFEIEVLRGGIVATMAHGTAVQLDQPVAGGWVVAPTGSADHPIVDELRRGGSATLAELSGRMDVDVDWLDATLTTLEDSGQIVLDGEGRWVPADLQPPNRSA